jgi:hypothetical protein
VAVALVALVVQEHLDRGVLVEAGQVVRLTMVVAEVEVLLLLAQTEHQLLLAMVVLVLLLQLRVLL